MKALCKCIRVGIAGRVADNWTLTRTLHRPQSPMKMSLARPPVTAQSFRSATTAINNRFKITTILVDVLAILSFDCVVFNQFLCCILINSKLKMIMTILILILRAKIQDIARKNHQKDFESV